MDESLKTILRHLDNTPGPHVLMMIGVPGSGKSHIASWLANKTGYGVISSDAIREELTGEERDQSRDRAVWKLLYQRGAFALAENVSLIIDATHNLSRQRREDIRYYRSHGAKSIFGIYVKSPLPVSMARNRNRSRIVPDTIISKMSQRLNDTPPSVDEGFDELYVVLNSDVT